MKAILDNVPELDTDTMAAGVRAALVRDPAKLERQMAALLNADVISTGR